jgi:hypothetical protein
MASEDAIKGAIELVEKARANKIKLRIVGGCAVRVHCPSLSHLHTSVLGRQLADVDFIGLSSQVKQIIDLLVTGGYDFDKYRSSLSQSSIILYKQKEHVDVFLDKLVFNHTIDLRRRLELDYPTISLADLLLQKLQIVNINEIT